MIQFANVTKRIGNFKLDNVSFEIPKGYICGLVGRNGSGKTTLLHLLLGLYRPGEGSIVIDGMKYDNNEKELRNLFGTVLVEDLLDNACSLEENGKIYGTYFSGYDHNKYKELLAACNLFTKESFGDLSKGQKLKAQFAFAVACNPVYLILDEPTANFDPDFKEQFLKILKDFVNDGEHSVLLATHLTDDLDRLADYLLYLENGKLIYGGDIESFREQYRIVSGEKYKINLLPKDAVLHIREGNYGAKALVRHKRTFTYEDLQVSYPTIEEFMYFFSNRESKR